MKTAMQRTVRGGWLILGSLLLLVSIPTMVMAQTGGTCGALVENAFEQVGANCANQELNTACYGNDIVGIGYFDPDADNVTWEPSAQTDLTNVSELETDGANLREQVWGLTVISAMSDIPRTIEDTSLVMAALGGVEIHNLVLPENAFEPLSVGLSVTTASATEYREATMTPPAGSDVLGMIPAGQNLVADAVSLDGLWVRVVFDGRPVWVAQTALEPIASIGDLPSFGPDSFTTMQSICMGNPRGNGSCGANAPSLMIVQSPSDFPVDMRVQGTDLRIQGTITLRMIGNRLEMNVLNGITLISPDTPDEEVVPAGFSVQASVGRPDEIGCAPLTGRMVRSKTADPGRSPAAGTP